MHERKVLVLTGLLLLPALACWGIAGSIARSEEAAFAGGAAAIGTVVAVLEDRVRFDGRDAEPVIEVRVQFTPDGGAPMTATTTVGSASGLREGAPVALQYLPGSPERIRLRDSFWRRSSPVVFLTLFGGLWLAIDVALGAGLLVLLRRRA